MSDKGRPEKRQLFVEHPPVVASKVRSYINSFKEIKKVVRDTYPDAKFYFKEVDEFEKPIIE